VGIGGDRSPGGNTRFARDVLVHQPTALIVQFGGNDARVRDFTAAFKSYVDGLQGIARQAKAANMRTAFLTPIPNDGAEQGPTALTGYNQTLKKFSDSLKVVADRNGWVFVDEFHPYLAVLDRARSGGGKYLSITGGDPVHPGPPGQALMAASILKGLGFPSLVSSAEIDIAGRKVVATENCTVEILAAEDGRLRFTRTDGALPFFPADSTSILKWSPILEDLNDYRLKVTGLAPGRYQLRLDGKRIAEVSAEQLAAGTNLASAALSAGPIADQSKSVRAAVEKKNKFHHDMIFRGVVLSDVPDWIYGAVSREAVEVQRKAVVEERLAELAALDAEIANALIMKANTFEVVPVR
jgi:lysophospholipase L1-like esterase